MALRFGHGSSLSHGCPSFKAVMRWEYIVTREAFWVAINGGIKEHEKVLFLIESWHYTHQNSLDKPYAVTLVNLRVVHMHVYTY